VFCADDGLDYFFSSFPLLDKVVHISPIVKKQVYSLAGFYSS